MAPRGRPRKNAGGQTRMDAAFDAMRPYGFSESLVKVTVKELLDVYGGSDGWMFIEDGAYMLLIETLLAKQQGSTYQAEDDAGEENKINFGKSEALTAGNLSAVGFLGSAKLEPSDAISRADNIASATNGSGPSDGNHQQQSVESCVATKEETMERTLSSSPPPNEETFPARPRRPYYGWISSDDEDDQLIELPAAPFPTELAKLLNSNI